MKKLIKIKEFYKNFVDTLNDLDNDFKNQIIEINKEYKENVTKEKIALLLSICNGENLDFDKIKDKYLSAKEINYISINETVKPVEIIEEDLLDKMIINGKEYYYESKEKGIIYDLTSTPVGIIKNGIAVLN